MKRVTTFVPARALLLAAILAAGCGRGPQPSIEAGGGPYVDLEPVARALFDKAMGRLDDHWDGKENLMGGAGYYPIRENAYYAAGLLFRDAPGDAARADAILGRVLDSQYRDKGTDYYGAFRRVPGETPPPKPRAWHHYDPNWREYVGTTLILVLRQFEAKLSPERQAGIREAVRMAGEGAYLRKVKPDYTNIAIMSAVLLDVAGAWNGQEAWRRAGVELAEGIHATYRPNRSLPEYNSPTYYGVDLFGLALWRRLAASPRLSEWGAGMESGLWHDIGRFYHARLRNMAGPYDRAYGVSMQEYEALVGVWIAMLVPEPAAPLPASPLPAFRKRIGAELDFMTTPVYVILGTRVPVSVTNRLFRFEGERHLRRVITDKPRRVATAWLGEHVMLGGEFTSGRGDKPFLHQLQPAIVHWRAPDGSVGWIRLRATAPADAQAAKRELTIRFNGEATGQPAVFDISAPGLQPRMIQGDRWRLPGLTVSVNAAGAVPVVTEADGRLEVRYDGMSSHAKPAQFRLRVEETP